MSHELYEYPTPRNQLLVELFGSLAGIVLVIMIVTGITLAMHYTPHTALAFDLGRTDNAGCQLWVADPVHSYEWRFNVLHNCLYPYFQGPLFWLL